MSFLPHYCHSFHITVIPSGFLSFFPNTKEKYNLSSLNIELRELQILTTSKSFPYPKGEKDGHRRCPYMRVLVKIYPNKQCTFKCIVSFRASITGFFVNEYRVDISVIVEAFVETSQNHQKQAKFGRHFVTTGKSHLLFSFKQRQREVGCFKCYCVKQDFQVSSGTNFCEKFEVTIGKFSHSNNEICTSLSQSILTTH